MCSIKYLQNKSFCKLNNVKLKWLNGFKKSFAFFLKKIDFYIWQVSSIVLRINSTRYLKEKYAFSRYETWKKDDIIYFYFIVIYPPPTHTLFFSKQGTAVML